MKQLDAKQAFMQAGLTPEEQLLLVPPKNSAGVNGDYFFLLLRSLYGLVQAAAKWNELIRSVLEKHGFVCVDCDNGIYVRYDENDELICALALHVDDCLITAKEQVLESVSTKLKQDIEMREEPGNWFLKIQISRGDRFMTLSQPLYAAEIVKEMGMEGCNTVDTPMETILTKGEDIPITQEEEEFMADKYEQYSHVVGMLGHLMQATRPDLAFSVAQLRQYVSCPRRHHYAALKRVVRYVNGTLTWGLVFDKTLPTTIIGCVDSDFANDVDSRRSWSGYAFLSMGAAVAFKSKKQRVTIQGTLRKGETDKDRTKRKTSDVSRSTQEAEIRALDLADRKALWLRKLSKALRMEEVDKPLVIKEDNQACYYIMKRSTWSAATKHVATMYFAIRDDIVDDRVDIIPVDSKDNWADIFTKPLRRVLFQKFRSALGVRDCSAINNNLGSCQLTIKLSRSSFGGSAQHSSAI